MHAFCAEGAPSARIAVGLEEAHLLEALKVCLARRASDMGRSRRDLWLVRENRRMIRQLLARLRQLRAGVAPAWIGLGRRDATDIEYATKQRKRKRESRIARPG